MVDVSISHWESTPSLFAEGERGRGRPVCAALPRGLTERPTCCVGLGELGRGAFALVFALAVAVARDFVLRLLTSPAVERAEHRSGTRGEEAHVFERSELCAVPSFREERREPAGAARRIASRPCFLLVTFSLHEQRKVTRSPSGERKLLILPWLLLVLLSLLENLKAEAKLKARAKAFAPASHERATLTSHSTVEKAPLCLCKEKVAKRKHALPSRPTRCARRVHSAAGIFRHDIPVVSKNDVHPCTSPLRGLFRRLRRYGREPERQKQEATAKSRATATATATAGVSLAQA